MIDPFRGLRPAPDLGPLQDLVSPPYDKIGPQKLAVLRCRHACNAVHLIRGEQDPNDAHWHSSAARRLESWVAAGKFHQEPLPAYYVIRQSFVTPGGQRLERCALVGALHLGAAGRVHAHERTHRSACADRLALLRATGCHLGQIFLLRQGQERLRAADLPVAEVGEVTDEEGTRSSFGILRDAKQIQHVEQLLQEADYIIADGHHRFSTAMSFAREHPEADRVMVSVVDLKDPGLVVLPTHRLLRGLEEDPVRALCARLKGLAPCPELREHPRAAAAALSPGQMILATRDGAWRWSAAGGAEALIGELDVVRLNRAVVEPLLRGLPPEEHLGYARDPLAALEEVRAGHAGLLALLAPIPAEVVAKVALSGGVMPQKSTDFHPKLPTGFVYLMTRAAPFQGASP